MENPRERDEIREKVRAHTSGQCVSDENTCQCLQHFIFITYTTDQLNSIDLTEDRLQSLETCVPHYGVPGVREKMAAQLQGLYGRRHPDPNTS